MAETPSQRADRALNRVAKWRSLFSGWQLGTRLKGDPEGDAVRDHREVSILLRVESNAVIRLMLDKGIITHDEWATALADEAEALEKAYERRFPGVVANANGLTFDKRALPWMKGWRP